MQKDRLQEMALTWAQRAQAELGAKARFMELTHQLIDAKASVTVIQLSKTAIEEEDRHADLCSEMALELGHATGYELFQGMQLNVQKSWESLNSFSERLLCEMTLMCCITETINASLLNSIYGQGRGGKARRLIQQILKDEVKHSQMGWAHLAMEAQKRDVGFLGQYLGDMLEISIKDELFIPTPDQYDPEDFQYGVMPVSDRLGQFTETLEQVVLPGFEKYGIDTQSAKNWLLKKSRKSDLFLGAQGF